MIQYLNQSSNCSHGLNDLKSGIGRILEDRFKNPSSTVDVARLLDYSSGGAKLNDQTYSRVVTIIWDLIIEGVIRPGDESGREVDLPFFHVTDYGKAKIKDSTTPYDPDGYLKRISTNVLKVDEVIITYLTESLHAFRIGCLLSSTITLGCASEKALLLLIAAYGDALIPDRAKKFRTKVEGKVIKQQFDEFQRRLQGHLMGLLPKELKENLDNSLNGIFSMLRMNRNEAGHPTVKTIDREIAYANLVVFPIYLKTVYTLIDWLSHNAPLSESDSAEQSSK